MRKNQRIYDAVLILGGNITKNPDGSYSSTTYKDSDEFGLLGGHMRVLAAFWMYMAGEAETFVFSTGTSEKTKAAFGDKVPTEAKVYSEEFKKLVTDTYAESPREFDDLDEPVIILEDRSKNTTGNVRECFEIIRQHGWADVCIVSADFHIARVEALCNLISQESPVDATLTFVGAETTLKRLQPGKYDDMIDAAYASPEAQKRFENEARGLEHMKSGKYVLTEYQLADKNLQK